MATKKDIAKFLKDNNLSELDMDKMVAETIPTNWKLEKMVSECANGDWRKLHINIIMQIPGQKERDLKQRADAEAAAKAKEEADAKEKADREYYAKNFYSIILNKIDSNEALTERESREIINECSIETTHIGDHRWQALIESIVQIGDRTFSVSWMRGLTENQESSYDDCTFIEVKKVKKVIETEVWEPIK